MTLLEKINQAQSKQELDRLNIEIIMDMENFPENQKAFKEKLKDLERDERFGSLG